ncbi:MAG: NAD-dependent epimerase/dehydratase family protein [Taibaiella sp.]|nr:NAD-dependent epimerase/dehydratase family protein [Taibaiella sp.]
MILLTGASGFLGQHMVRYLSAQGCIVRALYNNNQPIKSLLQLPGVSWAKCDLLDVYDVAAAMQGITEVYHCAAIVSFNPKRREEMLHTNTESTANIVNEALAQRVRKLVYVSSVAALGRNEGKHTEITEEEEWEESTRNSFYGQSKYMAEMEVWRGIAEGLDAAIVNPGIILGEGDWNEGSANIMKVVYGQFPFYTLGVNAWVDVNDVVNAMYLLMKSAVSAERFILNGGNYSYKDIFTMMAAAVGRKPPHINATPFMTSLVANLMMLRTRITGRSSAITKETASNGQLRCYYDNTKLPGFIPAFSYTPIQDTINRIGKAFLVDVNKK